MNNSNILPFIAKLEIFHELEGSNLEHLLPFLVQKSYKAGEYIYQTGALRKNLHIIYSGEVALVREDQYGNEIVINTLKTGDYIGEGSLLDSYPHSTSAKIIKEAEIIRFSAENFKTFLTMNPELGIKIISNISRIISRRVRRTIDKASGLGSQYVSGGMRTEHDLLGERQVSNEVYYGVQTLRALENFDISGVSINHYPLLIVALAQVKQAAAKANAEEGTLDQKVCDAICAASEEIIHGKFHRHFVVDIFQGGAGTSTNMNANEVIANRALELLGYERGNYKHCHPNEHVNMSQSTNDVYPTALKIALIYGNSLLVAELKDLIVSFRNKAKEFAHIIKMGRTQLQDAVPMTMGQGFEAYAVTLEEEVQRLNENSKLFLEVNMGGTAIGTGINAEKKYRAIIIDHLKAVTGLDLVLAGNLVEATQDTGSFIMYSSAVKRLAVKLSKICNDLRLLSSGPRAGFNEINLPPMQPGSSIMPGKVNPVIPEVVNQIAFNVIGNDLTVTLAAEAGQLELNVMEPVIAQSLFEMTEMLKNGMRTLKYKCIDGITANEDVCRRMVENSIGIVTALNPLLGYEICSQLAKEAFATNAGIYELVLKKGLLSKKQLDEVLSPKNMIG